MAKYNVGNKFSDLEIIGIQLDNYVLMCKCLNTFERKIVNFDKQVNKPISCEECNRRRINIDIRSGNSRTGIEVRPMSNVENALIEQFLAR